MPSRSHRQGHQRGGTPPAGPLDRAGKKVKSYDKFPNRFALKMDDGVGAIKSYMGCFCTFIWVCIILVYAAQKIDVLAGKKGVKVLATVKDLHFEEKQEFNYKDNGLNIAVAFTGFDNERTWSLDPRYGELVVNAYEWGYDENGDPFTERKPLNTHNCTREELNLEDSSDSQFYDIHISSEKYVDFYW